LSTVGDVEVERFDKNNGLEWLVTFITNSGDNHFTSDYSHRTDRVGDVPPILVSTDRTAEKFEFFTPTSSRLIPADLEAQGQLQRHDDYHRTKANGTDIQAYYII
jgi:hypothetical protein